MKIINKTKNTILAENAVIADTVFKRMKGLLARKGLKPEEALVLKPCKSIHTFFMRFPIDVVFVGQDNRIIKAIQGLAPWRLTGIYFLAQYCIELPIGTLTFSHTSSGDLLFIGDSDHF